MKENDNLKCITCKPPERNEHCHKTCKYYLEWKKQKDEENKKIRKKKWLKEIRN